MLKNQKMNLDLRIVSGVLLVALVASVLLWQPWQSDSARTITVSGEASKKAEPNQYQFSPSYQQKGIDRAAIQKELTDKINMIVAKLKEIGVDESDITLATYTYDNYWNDGTNEITSNTITINVENKELSQKVQDYLLTTSPEGQISPYPSFTTEKRKEIEDEVRSLALTDAKKKADRSVGELGAKLGKVMSIEDQSDDFMMPYGGGMTTMAIDSAEGSAKSSSLPVLAGKQEVTYTVTVTYQIK